MIQGVNQRLKPLVVFSSFVLLAALAVSWGSRVAKGQGSQPFSPAPYRVGERLTYNISFSNFISAAHIELLVAGRGTFFGREGLQLKGHVETNGVVNAALFAVNNDYVTYVDPLTGLPFRSEQTIREASRTAETSADFNQAAGTAAIPSKSMGEVPGTYDFLSAIYRIRALPLSNSSNYALSVRNENQNYQIEVRAT